MFLKESLTRSSTMNYKNVVYKLSRVKCEANFASLGLKIVKRLRRRKYYKVTIERTIGHVVGPSTPLNRYGLSLSVAQGDEDNCA